MKRGLEQEFQNEKKIKIDTGNNKKEIELSDETEVLFEEQFKSWEEQFLKWKEQNKNHPDKVKYIQSFFFTLYSKVYCCNFVLLGSVFRV